MVISNNFLLHKIVIPKELFERTLISSRASRSECLGKFLENFRKKFSGRQTQEPQIQVTFHEENVCDEIRLIFSNLKSFVCFVCF